MEGQKPIRLFGRFLREDLLLKVSIALFIFTLKVLEKMPDIPDITNLEEVLSVMGIVLKKRLLDIIFNTLWISFAVYLLKLFQESVREQKENQVRYNQRVDSLAAKIHSNLPRLTSLITRENHFESTLEKFHQIQTPGARWIYSKFISSLLEKSFSSFTIRMTPLEYSGFSSELFNSCERSIFLTGSMRPSEWLNSLVDTSVDCRDLNEERRGLFFNNQLDVKEFMNIISDTNHSLTLTNNTAILPNNKFRVVCLEKHDWEYLFMSERSIDAYYIINDPRKIKHSYFRKYSQPRLSLFNPFKYEYALYDEELLLRYDREKNSLTLVIASRKEGSIDEQDEFAEAKVFFKCHIDSATTEKECDLKGYLLIKEEVRKDKLEILESILDSKMKKLPHKLCYLYSGGLKWEKYINKDTTKYKSSATKAVEDGVRGFFGGRRAEDQNLEIIEIGAGTGEKTIKVCEVIAHRINSYVLLDISSYFLEKSGYRLQERMPHLVVGQNIKKILLDCCLEKNKEEFCRAIDNRDVFILSNSTLLTEAGFNWCYLKKARKIFITIDLLVKKEDDQEELSAYLKKACSDYLQAKELLLYPLKIFEIPIKANFNDTQLDTLFSFAYNDASFSLQVKFNLQGYFDLCSIDFGNLKGFDQESLISSKQESNTRRRSEINNEIKQRNNRRQKLHEDYIAKREGLKSVKELIILESLKFKYDKANPEKTETEITNYFNELDFSTEVKLFEYENGNKTEAFAAILLTPY